MTTRESKTIVAEIVLAPAEVPKERMRVELKQELATPIDRGDYTVTRRKLNRIHPSEEGFTLYFQEGSGEASESFEWDEETKAALQVFINKGAV